MGKRIPGMDQDLTEVVGMPDEWDKKNIETLINVFKTTVFPLTLPDGKMIKVKGDFLIKQCVIDSVNYHKNTIDLSSKGYNLKSADSGLRPVISMPDALDQKLRQGYPTLFRGKHLRWFLRNFPEFKISKEKF